MILTTFLVFFCLFSAFLTYGLGVFVYARNLSKTINQLFLILMLAATYWGLGEFLIWNSESYSGFLFWLKISSFWPFTVAFCTHFILIFTGHPLSRKKSTGLLLVLFYIPAAAFSLIGLFTDEIFQVEYIAGSGYAYLPVTGSPAYLVETIYIVAAMIWSAYLCFVYWRRENRVSVRRQSRYISIGLAAVIFFGSLDAIIFTFFKIYIPNLVFIGIVIFSILISFSILRHGLFILSPESAVPDILRTIPDGLILVDMTGRIVTANASASHILGAGEEVLAGRPILEFIPAGAYASICGILRERGSLSDFEAVLLQEIPRVVSIAASLVRSPDRKQAGYILVIRDITARKASERDLQIANEKLSLLNRVTRHDISNLITSLTGYLTLLRDEGSTPESRAYVDASIGLVDKIIRHLRFSGEYQDIGVYQPAWQPLATVVDQAIADLEPGDVQVIREIAPVEIYADPLSVRVFSNILENALRHGEKLTEIRISTESQAAGEMQLIIEDNGVGISAGEKELIFQYGYGKNTGFGLSFCRDILSVTGITIRETGTAGTGARFEIDIPRQDWRMIHRDTPAT